MEKHISVSLLIRTLFYIESTIQHVGGIKSKVHTVKIALQDVYERIDERVDYGDEDHSD
jgi:hypothetical protein